MSTSNQPFGFGKAATQQEIAGWDIAIKPDGAGLPPGRGTVHEGKTLFAKLGAPCHGPKGEGSAIAPRLVGGQGTLNTDKPVKTIGSYWPYATTLFDYIRRAMPANNPQSLKPDETYALVAYLLYLNGIIEEDAVMDATTLPKVVMPNHAGFTSPDPRPDVFPPAGGPQSTKPEDANSG